MAQKIMTGFEDMATLASKIGNASMTLAEAADAVTSAAQSIQTLTEQMKTCLDYIPALETIRTGPSVTDTLWDWLFGGKDDEGNQTWNIDGEQVMDSLKNVSISYFSSVPASKQFDEGWADLYDVRTRFQTFSDNSRTELLAITDLKYIQLKQTVTDPDTGIVTEIAYELYGYNSISLSFKSPNSDHDSTC
jgi:hypothetical protein